MMNFEIEQQDKYTLVKTNVDKLDSTQAPDLKSELVYLNKQGIRNIIIDLGKTKYCDSSGLSAILVANRLCKDAGGTLVLAAPQENVQKLISISQLESVLNVTPTVDEAVDYLYMEEVQREIGKNK